VKKNLTYKEISLLIGILVAAIILLIVWLNPSGLEAFQGNENSNTPWFLTAVRLVIQQANSFLHFTL
jgi:hypothetical protein